MSVIPARPFSAIIEWPDADGWVWEKSSVVILKSWHGIDLSPDGTKVYMVREQADNEIAQWTLTTPWDIATLDTGSKITNSSISKTNCTGVRIRADTGGAIWFTQSNGAIERIYGYNATTPYSISGMTGLNGGSTNTAGLIPSTSQQGLFVKPDGSACYIISGTKIVQYNVNSWDETSLACTGACDLGSIQGDRDLYFKEDGTRVYTTSTIVLKHYNLSTPWDITTVSGSPDSTLSTTAQGSSAQGLHIRADGNKAYTIDSLNDKIHQYKKIGT